MSEDVRLKKVVFGKENDIISETTLAIGTTCKCVTHGRAGESGTYVKVLSYGYGNGG